MNTDIHSQSEKPLTRAIASVVGVEASGALAGKLLVESAFFAVTPMPDDVYQFEVKVDRKDLLQGGGLFPADEDRPFARASALVIGVDRSFDLASKLVSESAFYEVSPLPNGMYQFAVKVDRKDLLPVAD